MRNFGRVALGAVVASAVMSCGPSVSSREVADLKAEVEKLKKRLNAQDGERPNDADQRAFLQAREIAFDKKIAGERPDAATEEQRLIQLALTTADKDIRNAGPPSSEIKSFTCSESLCRAQTTHSSEVSYQAFTRAAFNGLPGKDDVPDRPRIYPAWFSITQAKTEAGKVSALFYLGRVPKTPKEAPSRPGLK